MYNNNTIKPTLNMTRFVGAIIHQFGLWARVKKHNVKTYQEKIISQTKLGKGEKESMVSVSVNIIGLFIFSSKSKTVYIVLNCLLFMLL